MCSSLVVPAGCWGGEQGWEEPGSGLHRVPPSLPYRSPIYNHTAALPQPYNPLLAPRRAPKPPCSTPHPKKIWASRGRRGHKRGSFGVPLPVRSAGRSSTLCAPLLWGREGAPSRSLCARPGGAELGPRPPIPPTPPIPVPRARPRAARSRRRRLPGRGEPPWPARRGPGRRAARGGAEPPAPTSPPRRGGGTPGPEGSRSGGRRLFQRGSAEAMVCGAR